MTKPTAKRGRKPGNANGRKKRVGRTAPGPLTPGGGNKTEALAEAGRRERKKLAWNLYVYERMTMQAIADYLTANRMPCTAKTVCLDLHEMAEAASRDTVKTQQHWLEMELARLDQLDRQLLPVARGEVKGDRVRVGTGKKKTMVTIPVKAEPLARLRLDAASQLRRNGESRRKLLGIDQQPDAGYVPTSQVASIVGALVGDIIAITAALPEIRAALAGALKKRFGVIDVTPERGGT
jgi:hypothetical protein